MRFSGGLGLAAKSPLPGLGACLEPGGKGFFSKEPAD